MRDDRLITLPGFLDAFASQDRGRKDRPFCFTRQDVLAELAFFQAAHVRTKWPAILAHLKELLAAGARSPGWNLSSNINVASKAGHPNVPLLEALAAVIAEGADPATLEAFPEWQAA